MFDAGSFGQKRMRQNMGAPTEPDPGPAEELLGGPMGGGGVFSPGEVTRHPRESPRPNSGQGQASQDFDQWGNRRQPQTGGFNFQSPEGQMGGGGGPMPVPDGGPGWRNGNGGGFGDQPTGGGGGPMPIPDRTPAYQPGGGGLFNGQLLNQNGVAINPPPFQPPPGGGNGFMGGPMGGPPNEGQQTGGGGPMPVPTGPFRPPGGGFLGGPRPVDPRRNKAQSMDPRLLRYLMAR